MSSKIETGIIFSIIVLIIVLFVFVPLFIIRSADTVNQYKNKPEIPEGEGVTILSGFFTYLIDYLAYIFLTFIDSFFQELLNISIIEIWPFLGAISSWILLIDGIIVIIIGLKILDNILS